jgi:hypothetical protein
MPEAPEKPDLGGLRIEAHKRGSRKAGKRIAIILFVLLAALVIVGGVYAYMHQTPSVQVATVDAPDTGPQALLNASGYVTPQRRATVAAKITGRVTGVFFTEGMHVHKALCWPLWTIPMRRRRSRPRKQIAMPRRQAFSTCKCS